MLTRNYYVYILASSSGVLYTGVTNNIQRRVNEHRLKLIPGFTKKYNVTKLVHYESFVEIQPAIAREKQLKAWTRQKRVALIESRNQKWADLTAEWRPDFLPE